MFFVVLGMSAVTTSMILLPTTVSWAAYLPFVVLSGALHSPRWHGAVLGLCIALTLVVPRLSTSTGTDSTGALCCVVAVGAVTLWRSLSRARVGVHGSRGESMLADLRSELLLRSTVPVLPESWEAQVCVKSAYGHPFSGDFVVARRTCSGKNLEVVLVDVSGKGLDAGTHSLMLSGAFDALMGSVRPSEFLPLANNYVARQEWSEGFASAVHLSLDLENGEYVISTAGHPPVAHYQAEAGGWRVVEGARGPVLGLVAGVRYPGTRGRLEPGDALLLYTDGVVEERGSDLDEGIGRLVTSLEQATGAGFVGVAEQVCAVAPAGHLDDRGAVLVWRTC
ncbi:PP2C family protein-serine/threonine phosphatase [Austwickia chelonae]|uniref:Putative serine/threonine protein phosphatase n=1 Tax=Austwickia chelonae NBRC 105200 TaxID=1184607 RepID=K6VKW5_9MICO|nr:PP2C family protein-serine/threonine phosphatase [Austwickia chelonae]GAB77389.1 putative serine/threonine protein phosphatase [Austwickia chelonae NBRC 105200]